MAKIVRTKVEIKDIEFDENLYPRASYDWKTAYDYSMSIKSGSKFPRIVLALYKGKKILVDGKHRIEAHKILKKEKIDAEVFVGWDRKRIYREAIERNIQHGKPLNAYDKRRIAIKLMELKMKKSEISNLIQVPLNNLDHFVGQRLTSSITGKEIKTQPIVLKSGMKHFSGKQVSREEIQDIEGSQEVLSGSSQRELFKQMISIVENKLVDLNDETVADYVEILRNLLNKNYP